MLPFSLSSHFSGFATNSYKLCATETGKIYNLPRTSFSFFLSVVKFENNEYFRSLIKFLDVNWFILLPFCTFLGSGFEIALVEMIYSLLVELYFNNFIMGVRRMRYTLTSSTIDLV